MDDVRDLGRIEPWQESLERSRARRGNLGRVTSARDERRPPPRVERSTSTRAPAREGASTRAAAPARRGAARRKARPSRRLVIRAGGLCALAFMVAGLASALAALGTQSSTRVARTLTVSAPSRSTYGGPSALIGVLTAGAAQRGYRTCQAASGSSGYVNPLAGARVRPERIDQGVDYAGSGTLAAIGAAKVTHVATTATGWPGAFIEYRLLDGSNAGCFVYYAEGVNPMPRLHVGQLVAAGQPIATITPGWSSGIELGWGAGKSDMTYASIRHQWDPNSDVGNVATEAGKSFSALIASLGGPPGKVER